MNNKTELREKAKIIRKSLKIKKISRILTTKIKDNLLYKNSKNIMIFYPTRFEVNLLELLEDNDKNFFLPKISGKELLVCPYTKHSTLIPSSFKTLEPTTLPIDKSNLDLIILPALMADLNNYRLGYGGGFYDRFLMNSKTKTILPLPKELIVNKLPTEPHDKRIDVIISC